MTVACPPAHEVIGFAGVGGYPVTTAHDVDPEWSARLDAGFKAAWLNWLIRHPDEWFHPTDVWREGDELQRIDIRQVAWEAVERARECGVVIDGDRTEGYCFRFYEIPRYARFKASKPRALPGDDAYPGQLSIAEGEGVG